MTLQAVQLNCTLKKSPEVSNTEALMNIVIGHLEGLEVECQMVIERLDGTYDSTNEVGQYPMYNKVAGVVVTGNEDGAHSAAETTLFNLSHFGFTIPPNADTYWVGDAGRAIVHRGERRRAPPHSQDSRVDGTQRGAHGAAAEGASDSPGGGTRCR